MFLDVMVLLNGPTDELIVLFSDSVLSGESLEKKRRRNRQAGKRRARSDDSEELEWHAEEGCFSLTCFEMTYFN